MNRLTEKVLNSYETICGNTDQLRDKVGKLEDTFDLIEDMYRYPVCFKINFGEVVKFYYNDSTILYNPKDNSIYIYEYSFIDSYKIEEYGQTWWLDKEEEK